MRISDWSSDVCSSDLAVGARHFGPVADDRKIVAALQELAILHGQVTPPVRVRGGSGDLGARMDPVHLARLRKGEETFVVDLLQEMLFSREQIGRASCRERVCQYV